MFKSLKLKILAGVILAGVAYYFIKSLVFFAVLACIVFIGYKAIKWHFKNKLTKKFSINIKNTSKRAR